MPTFDFNLAALPSGPSCPLTGAADDTPGLVNFRDNFAIPLQGSGPNYNLIRLHIPPGSIVSPNTQDNPPIPFRPFNGIKNLFVDGYGARFTSGAAGVLLGGIGVRENSYSSACLAADVNAGASSVTLPNFPVTSIVSPGLQNNGSNEIRVTVNSTTGYSNGMHVPISGVDWADNIHSFINCANHRVRVVSPTVLDLPISPWEDFQCSNFAPDSIPPCSYTFRPGAQVGGNNLYMFAVNQWAMVSGLDLMGFMRRPGGYPPNIHFFDFVKITNIDSATRTITFDRQLQNSYKTHWPKWNCGGDNKASDPGGPAMIYWMPDSWDCKHVYAGLELVFGMQIVANGRDITYLDCVMNPASGSFPPIPSQNYIYRWLRCNFGFSFTYTDGSGTHPNQNTVEVDKLIEAIAIWSGSHTPCNFQHQSSATNTMVVGGGANVQQFQGNARRNIFQGIDSALLMGTIAYGHMDSLWAKDCTFSTSDCQFAGLMYKGLGSNPFVPEGIQYGTTMVGGVITTPKLLYQGASLGSWNVPGTWCMWTGQDGTGANNTAWQITDVNDGDPNFTITTTWPGGYPTVGSNPLWVYVHPCPDFTFVNCTGNSLAVALSGRTKRTPLPVSVSGVRPHVDTSVDNGITVPTVPRAFVAKF